MKSNGIALVRNVSYDGAEFDILMSKLTPARAKQYADACDFWDKLLCGM